MIGTIGKGASGTHFTQMCVTDGNMFYTIDLHPGSAPGNIFETPRFFTPWNGEIYYQLEVTPAPWGYICKFNPDTLTTGLHNLNETGGVSIFPNPTNASFTVEANSFDNSTIKIYTISGSIVFEGRFDKKIIITLDINSGIYILELFNKNGQTRHVRFLHE